MYQLVQKTHGCDSLGHDIKLHLFAKYTLPTITNHVTDIYCYLIISVHLRYRATASSHVNLSEKDVFMHLSVQYSFFVPLSQR